MLHLPSQRRGRYTGPRSRLSWRRVSTLLYGRALDLPPSPLTPRLRADDGVLTAALRPFRRRLLLQRAIVSVLRLLALAMLVATAILFLRALGLAMPLPEAPLAGGGVVFAAGLAALLPREAPSAPQLAHAIDERLRLREQVASALEFEHDGGDNTSGLRRRAAQAAEAVIRGTTPDAMLAWPSLRREAYTLGALVLVGGATALAAAHAPSSRLAAGGAPARAPGAHRHAATARFLHTTTRTVSSPMKILAIGSNARSRTATAIRGARPIVAAPQRKGGSAARGGASHLVAGKNGALGASNHSGQGAGAQTGRTAGNATSGGAQATGQPGGRSAPLHLASGRNSAAGGVESPQQRALQNLRNSIQAAQTQTGQGQQANGPTGANGARNNQANNGQAANGSQSGQRGANGAGRRSGGARNGKAGAKGAHNGRNGAQNGAQGQNGQGSGSAETSGGRGASSGQGRAANGQRYGASGLYGEYGGRYGRPGAGSGADSGATGNPQGTSNGTRATLSNGTSLALSGAPNGGGQLIFSVGAPSRSPGTGASPLSGASANQPSIPGYVAPDSNATTPDDRSVVQGYFSPPAGGQ